MVLDRTMASLPIAEADLACLGIGGSAQPPAPSATIAMPRWGSVRPGAELWTLSPISVLPVGLAGAAMRQAWAAGSS
jgi:hypothetical protein